MTKQDELKAYKRALKDYQKGGFKDEFGDYLRTEGFCFYFRYALGFLIYGDYFYQTLPTLYLLKPKDTGMYWFPETDKQPRIELLKKAIEILEKELK